MAERVCEGWQLVYVLDGTVEESTDGKPQLLRTGRFLFHQPLERAAMRRWGKCRPKCCAWNLRPTAPCWSSSGRRSAPAAAAERNCLRLLAGAVREGWTLPAEPAAGDLPARRGDPPLGVGRLQVLYLEEFLWLLARRLGACPPPRPACPGRAEAGGPGGRPRGSILPKTLTASRRWTKSAARWGAASPCCSRLSAPAPGAPCGITLSGSKSSRPARCWPRGTPPARWRACSVMRRSRIFRSGSGR